jgi:hypothetical protein
MGRSRWIAIAERQHTDVLSRGRHEREAQGILIRRKRIKTPRSVPSLLLPLGQCQKQVARPKAELKLLRAQRAKAPALLDLCSLSPYAYLRAQARLARRSFGATHDPPAQSDFFNTMPMPDKESAREARVNRRPPVRFHGGRRMVSCGVRLPRSHLSPYGAASATAATFKRRHFSDFPHCRLLYMAA